jgi:hypothetical protein
MLPMRTKVTHVHYHLHKKICQIEVFVNHSYKATRSKILKEDYLSVVFHFVTDDWELEKRIVGMRLIDYSHSGVNIAERMLQVISEYNMNFKVFSITLDNASTNASAMIELTPNLVPYVTGFAIASGLLHQRCA